MAISFRVVGRLPTLNELIELRARSPHAYNRRKKQAHQLVGIQIPADFPAFVWARFEYHFYEPTRAFDPSNVLFGAVKVIEDALQVCGVMPNDGWKAIPGPDGIRLNYHHCPGEKPWVVVILEGERDGSRTRSDTLRDRRKAFVEKQKVTAQHHGQHAAAVGADSDEVAKTRRGRAPSRSRGNARRGKAKS